MDLKVMMAVVWSVKYSIVAEQELLAGLKTNNKSKHQLFSHSRELVFRWAADRPLPAGVELDHLVSAVESHLVAA